MVVLDKKKDGYSSFDYYQMIQNILDDFTFVCNYDKTFIDEQLIKVFRSEKNSKYIMLGYNILLLKYFCLKKFQFTDSGNCGDLSYSDNELTLSIETSMKDRLFYSSFLLAFLFHYPKCTNFQFNKSSILSFYTKNNLVKEFVNFLVFNPVFIRHCVRLDVIELLMQSCIKNGLKKTFMLSQAKKYLDEELFSKELYNYLVTCISEFSQTRNSLMCIF